MLYSNVRPVNGVQVVGGSNPLTPILEQTDLGKPLATNNACLELSQWQLLTVLWTYQSLRVQTYRPGQVALNASYNSTHFSKTRTKN